MQKQQYEAITNWQNEVFTKATPMSCANHLHEEVGELKEAIAEKSEGLISEVADCYLLLIGVCNKLGMSYSDIVTAIDDKMKINYERKWGQPNDQGYVKHVD